MVQYMVVVLMSIAVLEGLRRFRAPGWMIAAVCCCIIVPAVFVSALAA